MYQNRSVIDATWENLRVGDRVQLVEGRKRKEKNGEVVIEPSSIWSVAWVVPNGTYYAQALQAKAVTEPTEENVGRLEMALGDNDRRWDPSYPVSSSDVIEIAWWDLSKDERCLRVKVIEKRLVMNIKRSRRSDEDEEEEMTRRWALWSGGVWST